MCMLSQTSESPRLVHNIVYIAVARNSSGSILIAVVDFCALVDVVEGTTVLVRSLCTAVVVVPLVSSPYSDTGITKY